MSRATPKPQIPWKSLTPLQRKRLRANPALFGNPEYEAAEAACRDLTPQDAAAETAFLSRQFRERFRSGLPMVDLYQVIRALNERKVPFVLTGVHGMSTWTGRPRATQDVDVLVKSGRNFTRALKTLKDLYPNLETHDGPGVTGFFAPGEKQSQLDLIVPHRADLAATIDTAVWVAEKGLRYRIPTLEAALANKYGAMLNLARDPIKRGQDAVDFATMVKHSLDPGRVPIDRARLAELGGLVWPGGADEIIRFVEEARSGRVPRPDA